MQYHVPVLVDEIIEGLAIEKGNVVVDATSGDGGHLNAFCDKFGQSITLIGLDADREQIDRAEKRLKENDHCDVQFIETNFRYLKDVLHGHGYQEVDRVLFDLGWSSYQIDQSGRGFSLRRDEELQMTYGSSDAQNTTTAYEIVNTWDQETLQTVIKGYGEERFARRIAQAIVEARKQKPIERTKELAEITANATPVWYQMSRLHPATKTFQAIRIAANDELQALSEGLIAGFTTLAQNGRMAVISFHSLEDRIVKRQMRQWKEEGLVEIITKKPLTATQEERENNPRSRSAKLRIIKKISDA